MIIVVKLLLINVVPNPEILLTTSAFKKKAAKDARILFFIVKLKIMSGSWILKIIRNLNKRKTEDSGFLLLLLKFNSINFKSKLISL